MIALSAIDKIDLIKIKHHSGRNFICKIFCLTKTQFLISYIFIKYSRRSRMWFFFIADTLIMPIVTGKILGKKIFLTVGGSLDMEQNLGDKRVGLVLKLFKKINFYLADGIIIYSSTLIKAWHMEKYKNKIYIAHRHFVNFNKFLIIQKYQYRPNIIGYIGRLSIEKGVLNFVQAIPRISEIYPEYQFQIFGNGPQSKEISQYIFDHGLQHKVQLTGWIDHDEVPKILNNLKLFVLPSFSEGLPNIMLESMACGTPVVATAIGAIPDFIEDGKTGFILKNNSAECIQEGIVRAIESGSKESISTNGRNMVESHFTFERELEMFKKIFESPQFNQ